LFNYRPKDGDVVVVSVGVKSTEVNPLTP
jgi:hypothetical protein